MYMDISHSFAINTYWFYNWIDFYFEYALPYDFGFMLEEEDLTEDFFWMTGFRRFMNFFVKKDFWSFQML